MNSRHRVVTLQLLDTIQCDAMAKTIRLHENMIFTAIKMCRLTSMQCNGI